MPSNVKCTIHMRTVLWYLTFTGTAIDYICRISLNIAIVDITGNQQRFNNNNDSVANINSCGTCAAHSEQNKFSLERVILDVLGIEYKNGFEWNEYEQGLLLGAYYWLHWLTTIPGGILARKYGTKRIFGLALLIVSTISFLMPVAAHINYNLLILLRVIQGFLGGLLWSSLLTVIGKWIPPNERSKFISAFMGSAVGVAIFFPFFGWLMSIASWEWVFHTCGCIGIIWYVCWQYFMYNSPAEHPRIGACERDTIDKSFSDAGLVGNIGPTPWKQIFTSRGVWMTVIAQWGSIWTILTLSTQAPTYFKKIHKFNMNMTGILSGLPHLLKMIFSYLFAMFIDSLLRSQRMTRTNVRKFAGFVAYILEGAFVLGIAYSGHNSTQAFIFFTLAIVVHGAISSSALPNLADLSPNFSGILLGITLVIGMPTGNISALIVGWLTLNDQTPQNWKYVFLINAGIVFICGVLYILFAVSELQSWNSPQIDDLRQEEEMDSTEKLHTYRDDQ